MRKFALAAILANVPGMALSDARTVVESHIVPGYAAFASATAALDAVAVQSCDPIALRPAFHAAWDAWMAVQHIRFGPVEEHGRALAIAFWPDPKALGAKAQKALLTGDPAVLMPEAFAQQSVAARGLTGLERLLYTATPLAADPCPLVRATAADLARMADRIDAEWAGTAARTLLTAGAPDNTTYLSPQEADQVLFTQLVTGLAFLADQRIARPLGTIERTRPERAEARASGRSVVNVRAALRAMRAMAVALADDTPRTRAAFDRAIGLADALPDDAMADLGDPALRLKVEIVQQAVVAAREAALGEIGTALGVDVGFNAQDGD